MYEIIVTVVIVVSLCLILTAIVLGARLWLISTGIATITVNERQRISADLGDKLLWALASNSIILPTACGGRGSCGQCRVRIEVGGGQCLPNEETLITARDRLAGDRLACMVTIRNDLSIRLPESILNTKQLQCSVRSSRNITNYLRELILEPVGDGHLSFRAGDYLLVEAPPGQSNFIDFDVDKPYADEWRRLGHTDLTVTRTDTQSRAYSFANAPADQDAIMLIVRIALPPASEAAHAPPGQVSSFLYGLRAGDQVSVSGPFGEFHANDSNAEMVIIGGG